MGFISALAPALGAGGGLGGIGSLFTTILGSVLKPSAPSAPAPAPAPAPPAPPPEENLVDPGSVLDREAAQARSRSRRKQSSVQGGSLLGLSEGDTIQKTLLGE